jgi:hypothetical protein
VVESAGSCLNPHFFLHGVPFGWGIKLAEFCRLVCSTVDSTSVRSDLDSTSVRSEF